MTGTMCDNNDPLSDPLFSDEPLDLEAIRADEGLINALAQGDEDAARSLAEASDDALLGIIAAWTASVRPPPVAVAVHLQPVGRSTVYGCCHRHPRELPDDHVTDDPDAVTCPARNW